MKRRLNTLGKTVVTILIVISIIVVYATTPVVGGLAQDNKIWELVCYLEWFYLFFISFGLIALTWEN